MTDPKKTEEKSDDDVSSQNILRIADELVRQVDRTKKLALIMIIAIIIAVPVSWHVAPLVTGTDFQAVGYTAIAIAIVFLGIGVRQWMVLSKWTKRYKSYKELQKKVDEKLDFEGSSSTDKKQ
ncbi:MAG TPA: hypothetical protein VJN71_10735 [Nitrososphaerales archaeon]|nr:hypothetical protein [Nitrososphaerales archaeon]